MSTENEQKQSYNQICVFGAPELFIEMNLKTMKYSDYMITCYNIISSISPGWIKKA